MYLEGVGHHLGRIFDTYLKDFRRLSSGTACMQAVGIPAGKTSDYVVQNVWTRQRMSLITGDDPSITIDNVPPNGGSVYVRLDPQ